VLANRPAIEGRRGRDRPAVARNPGQKIDNALAPDLEGRGRLAGSSAGLGNLRLGEAFRPTPWGASGANHPAASDGPGECP